MAGSPGLPRRSLYSGRPRGRWPLTLKNSEQELSDFLGAQPSWLQKALDLDYDSMSPDEKEAFVGRDVRVCNELQQEYESILQRIPKRWSDYREKHARSLAQVMRSLMPKGTPGRKLKSKLAERIWKLDAEGRTNREIQQILNSDEGHLSLEAVESYLKTRRRKSQE